MHLGLISNGRYLKNGKILFFIYIMGKTFHIEGNVYHNANENRFAKLYIFPTLNNFGYTFSNMVLKITDLKPIYYLQNIIDIIMVRVMRRIKLELLR